MARARILKPGFFKNETLAECEPLARLLFEGLWCHADREGRLENRPKRLKAEILPYDDCDVPNLLLQLAAANFIVCYTVDGVQYIQIINYTKHQKPHPKEPPSQIPAMSGREIPRQERDEPRKETARQEPSAASSALPSFPSLPSSNPLPDSRGCSVAREGLEIIRRFDDLAAAVFGEHLRRAFPDGTDLVIADRWLAAGADMALCEAVFYSVMGRMKARGQGPPKSLKYFDQPISDALTTAKAPMPEGQVNGRKSGRLSPTEGIYAGFALALGQHEPEDDRGADSHAAEPLLDSGHAARAAPTPKRGLAG